MDGRVEVCYSREATLRVAYIEINCVIKGTRRCGPLRGPSFSSCGGLGPSGKAFFCPSAKKIVFYIYFDPNFGNFW